MSSKQINSNEPETGTNVVVDRPTEMKIKKCFVQLKKMDHLAFDSHFASSVDLPDLPYFSSGSSKAKSEKSAKELMEEHENLAKYIKVLSLSQDSFEEKLKKLEVLQKEVEDKSLNPPPAIKLEKSNILFVNDTFQYFNTCDVSPLDCGYDRRSTDLSVFEKAMLSFERVELEHVLSSFLFSFNIYCISDCKSFVTFLLRNLSVHGDIACVQACYNVLLTILDKHPSSKGLKFNSAEIFMLLFNYGIDIDSFKFLSKRPDIRGYLGEPKCKNQVYNKIHENWIFNFKMTLNAVINLIQSCEFDFQDLCNIVIYFLWMILDSSILHGNIFSTVRECISVTLNSIPMDKWSKIMHEVAWTLISIEFLSSSEKWRNLYHMTKSVPVTSERGLELRKYISFLILTWLGKVESAEESSKEKIIAEINKTPITFSLDELQSLLENFVKMDPNLIAVATKFLDICISDLKATDEDFKELCNSLKQFGSMLKERAHEAKAYFSKIQARLKIQLDENVTCETHFENDNTGKCVVVKKEVDVDIENVPNPFHLFKITEEEQFGNSSCSVHSGILIENGVFEEYSITISTLEEDNKCILQDVKDKLHLEIDNRTDIVKNILNEVDTKLDFKEKHLKRTSDDDCVKKELLELDFSKKNEEVTDAVVTNVLNDLLKSTVTLTKDDVDKSVYNSPLCTKSLQNNVPDCNAILFNPSTPSDKNSLTDQFIFSFSNEMPEESNLESVVTLQVNIQEVDNQTEENLMVKCLQSSKIKPILRKDNKIENMRQPRILHNSSNKNLLEPNVSLLEPDQKKDIQPKCKIKTQVSQKEAKSNTHLPQKRKNEFSRPLSKIQKHSMNLFAESEASELSDHSNFDTHMPSISPSEFSSKKSFLCAKSFDKKSSNTYIDCLQMRNNYCGLKHSKKEGVPNNTRLNLGNVLRERLGLSSSNELEQNLSRSTEIYKSSDSDSDVQELYCDPKRYADKECIIVFESEDQIVLDSD